MKGSVTTTPGPSLAKEGSYAVPLIDTEEQARLNVAVHGAKINFLLSDLCLSRFGVIQCVSTPKRI